MDLNPYVDDLQHRLAVAAELGGDEALDLARRLSAPLDAATRLVLLEALSAAAGEITAELAPGSVDVRLRGRDPEFVVTAAATTTFEPASDLSAAAALPAAVPLDEAAATSRTTLRLPDQLKAQVEQAAARDGVSVNTWLVRAIAAAVAPAPGQRPTDTRPAEGDANRVTGWVR
ncbi:toxin-antitoxin system HicB family antitoxin [Agromyces tropicus]|uniref:Toxin-antitoxin system HicB family antitoxin n=1 Tax=Agromyces tropicus TaxID=555371 RepID=A0ABN2U4I2_9MICO